MNTPNPNRDYQTYDIEKESLEAHIAIEAERWYSLNSKIDNVHKQLSQDITSNKTEVLQATQENNRNINKLERIIIWAMGSIFLTVLGAVVTVVLR